MTEHNDKPVSTSAIPNKYLMACMIAKRARQLSEMKGRVTIEEGESNPIDCAMKEIEEGKIVLSIRAKTPSSEPGGDVVSNDAGMENQP
ncbi:MAG: DNA-directed RNA polymerase subunit omega [Thermovirgaceae bacterium]|nr:DNA-directed RNA polymerase subunit omega [Thermovirgaceae bacterium]